jgi:hypothetical protein
MHPAHVYEIRPRKDKRGFDLISDVLPFGRLWYGEPNAASNAVDYDSYDNRRLAVSRERVKSRTQRIGANPAHDFGRST